MYKYYIAIAVRWGDVKAHSYPITVTDDIALANLFGACEYSYRGSKYNHIIKVFYSKNELDKLYINYINEESKKIIFNIFENEKEAKENYDFLNKINKNKKNRTYSAPFPIESVKNIDKQLAILESNEIDYFESVFHWNLNKNEQDKLKLIYETFLREKQKSEIIIEWINQTKDSKGLETFVKFNNLDIIWEILNHHQVNYSILDKLFLKHFKNKFPIFQKLLRSELILNEEDLCKIIKKHDLNIKPAYLEYPFFENNKYSDQFYLKILDNVLIQKDKETGWFRVMHSIRCIVKNKNISFDVLTKILILLNSIKNNKISESSMTDVDDVTIYQQLINSIKKHPNYLNDAVIISNLLKN